LHHIARGLFAGRVGCLPIGPPSVCEQLLERACKRVPVDVLVWAVGALAEGLGIRAVARVFEVDPNTVLAWLVAVCLIVTWPPAMVTFSDLEVGGTA